MQIHNLIIFPSKLFQTQCIRLLLDSWCDFEKVFPKAYTWRRFLQSLEIQLSHPSDPTWWMSDLYMAGRSLSVCDKNKYPHLGLCYCGNFTDSVHHSSTILFKYLIVNWTLPLPASHPTALARRFPDASLTLFQFTLFQVLFCCLL